MEGKKISRSLCAPESSEGRKEGERWLFYFSATRENFSLRNVDKAETKGGRRWFELKILGCVNSRW